MDLHAQSVLFNLKIDPLQYGLIPEDYKPFPEDQMYGDYPDLQNSSADSRPGNEYWDFPEFRRNFNEPLHLNFDWQQETRLAWFGVAICWPNEPASIAERLQGFAIVKNRHFPGIFDALNF